MMTSRPFSWNNLQDPFHNRRGSAGIWLIAALCFVFVFLGVAFLLLREAPQDRKEPTVVEVAKREVREPIKPYAPPEKSPVEMAKADTKPEPPPTEEMKEVAAPPEKAGTGEVKQPVQEAPEAGSPKIQNVLPDDPPGKGVLAQDLERKAPMISQEAEKASQVSSSPPDTTTKPPVIPEKRVPAEKEMAAEDKEPTTEPTQGVSAVKEEKPVEAPQPAKETASETGEKNFRELTVMVLKGNVRKGPSVKEAVLFRIERDQTLQMVEQKGNWYAIRLDDGRSGWAHRSLFKAPSVSTSGKLSAKLPGSASASPGKRGKDGLIKGIRTVVTDPDHAQIIFELNGYYPPEIMVIEGETPRVVCDFFSVRLARGVKKTIPVKTDVVKRIRVGVHKEPKPKIRVVLDLNAGQNYAVEQFFFEKENYYALMINSTE